MRKNSCKKKKNVSKPVNEQLKSPQPYKQTWEWWQKRLSLGLLVIMPHDGHKCNFFHRILYCHFPVCLNIWPRSGHLQELFFCFCYYHLQSAVLSRLTWSRHWNAPGYTRDWHVVVVRPGRVFSMFQSLSARISKFCSFGKKNTNIHCNGTHSALILLEKLKPERKHDRWIQT